MGKLTDSLLFRREKQNFRTFCQPEVIAEGLGSRGKDQPPGQWKGLSCTVDKLKTLPCVYPFVEIAP